MTPFEMEKRIVRYGDLKPCRTAFIDTHTPGSDRKENFTIIGAGVSESADQHVHIREKVGFNVGAAGQPPHCVNSLHTHRTAEVFFVHRGRWRFFWGRRGTAGEVVLDEGDLFDIPTGMFRGFENVGTDYGIIMAILGGDDAGGGVVWAPQVIEEARDHGLVLAETGRLYDTAKGETLPAGERPMPVLTEDELSAFPEVPVEDVVPAYVGRYRDLVALAAKRPARVLGADGALIYDRPGFEIDFLTRSSLPPEPLLRGSSRGAHGPPGPLAPRIRRRRIRPRPRRHLRRAAGARAPPCADDERRGGALPRSRDRRPGRSDREETRMTQFARRLRRANRTPRRPACPASRLPTSARCRAPSARSTSSSPATGAIPTTPTASPPA